MVKQKSSPKNFFAAAEKQQIVRAIGDAEQKTSGEIRVFLERRGKDDTLGRAQEIFEKLGMTKTRRRNGVLIYLSLLDRQFAVLGDQGIYDKTGGGFWKDVVSLMKDSFARGDFAAGLEAGIQKIGEKLKVHFPRDEGDVNELPNEV